MKYFRPDALRFAAVLGLMLAGAIVNLLKPWPLALIVDCVLDHKPPPHWFGPGAVFNHGALLAGLSAALLLLYVLHGVFAVVQNYLPVEISLGWLRRLHNEVVARLSRRWPRLRLNTRDSNMWPVRALQNGLYAFLSVAVMFWMNIYLTLLCMALAPLVVLTFKSFGAKLRDDGKRGWELALRFAITVIFALGTAAIVWLGAVQVASRHLTTGELLVFLAYLAQIFEPLTQPSRVQT